MEAKDIIIESAAQAAAIIRAALPKEQKEERVFVSLAELGLRG